MKVLKQKNKYWLDRKEWLPYGLLIVWPFNCVLNGCITLAGEVNERWPIGKRVFSRIIQIDYIVRRF